MTELVPVYCRAQVPVPGPVNWLPLYDYLVKKYHNDRSALSCLDEYMFMSRVGFVYCYKHIDTREYVNVDGDGCEYQYRDGGYWPKA